MKMKRNGSENVGIKNRLCCCFDDITKIEDFDFEHFIERKIIRKYFDLWHFVQTFFDAEPFRIMFNKTDGLIRDFDGTKDLVWFGLEIYDATYDRIRYLLGLKKRY